MAYLFLCTSQSEACFSMYGLKDTASSHISCYLKWSGIILNDQCSIPTAISHICVKTRSGTSSNRHGFFSAAFSHIPCVLIWSGTRRSSTEGKQSNTPPKNIIVPGSTHTAVSHISWVLKSSGTYFSMHGVRAASVSHISGVLRLSGICLSCDPLPRHTFPGAVKYISVCGSPAWYTKIHF